MWFPGTPVQITTTGTAQRLTTTVGLVKAIRFEQHWNNTHRLFWGDSSLVSATPAGIIGWLPPPTPNDNQPPADIMEERDAPNGINALQVYIEGTAGEYVLWSYCIQ